MNNNSNPISIPGRGPGKGNRFLRQKEKPKDFKKTISRLWEMFGDERKKFIITFVLVICSTITTLLAPYLIGKAIDKVSVGVNKVDSNGLFIIIFTLLAVYIIDGLVNLTQGITMSGISQRIVKNIRRVFFHKLQKLSIAYFDSRLNGDLMSRLTNDIDNISTTISSSLITLMSGIINISGSLIMMLLISPILTIAALITVPLIFILSKVIASKTKLYFKEQQKDLGILNGNIEESITGIEVIKAFNREEKIIESFEKLNSKYRLSGYNAQLWSGYLMPLINVINNIGFATIALCGGVLAVRNLITIGVIVSFISYSKQFVRPLNDIANIYNTLQSAMAGAERVFEVIDEKEEENCENYKELTKIKGKVQFENVSFGYNENKMVLKNINFLIQPSTSIAIVGPTGSGKTTIVNLLTRFYEVNEGIIKIDDINIKECSRESLRKAFGIVLQDTYLFSGTISENIKYGKLDAKEEEVVEASKIANAHGFISILPQGYNTKILEGGNNLSAGQRQLIAIARAVLSNPDILILDEATSNVDTRTELKIQQAMLRLMNGRTTFIIAHRLSTIRDADYIMVIEDGEIVEFGSHEELIAKGEKYYNLCTINSIN